MAEGTTRKGRHRSPGEGSAYEIGEGRWRGALTWTDNDGKRHRRVVSGSTSAQARDRLDDLRRELKLGTITPAGGGTVAEYLTDWLERERTRIRPSTWRGREQHVRAYLIPAFGRLALARLTPVQVERAMNTFAESGRPKTTEKFSRALPARPVSPLTVRHVRATLRRALADAVRDGRVGRNAAADARPPYVPHRPVGYLSAPDVRRLLDATRNDPFGLVYALAASTGLRLGELLGLTWPDVDLEAGTLTVRRSLARARDGGWTLSQPKSAKSRRTIPLPSIAREALTRRKATQEAEQAAAVMAWQDRDELVFTDSLGRYVQQGSVSHAFHDARMALGLPPVRFHDLRHSAATLMLAEGVPLAVISEWLGHAGIAITAAHYAAVVPALRRDAADAIDRALSPRADRQSSGQRMDDPEEVRA
jgi:integrase